MRTTFNAKDLLKEKGYVENKFDTPGFTRLVFDWFRRHELKDRLLLRPKRFIEMENPPTCGYIDMTDTDKWVQEVPFEKLLLMLQKGEVKPFIFIDKPFMKNAVYMLQVMNGFIVEKGKKGIYEVSLI